MRAESCGTAIVRGRAELLDALPCPVPCVTSHLVSFCRERTFLFPDRPTHCPSRIHRPRELHGGHYGLDRGTVSESVQPAEKARVVPAADRKHIAQSRSSPLVVSCSLQSRPVTRSAGTGRFTGHVTTGRPAVTIASYGSVRLILKDSAASEGRGFYTLFHTKWAAACQQ
jgi:hypothetical protein